MKRIGLYGIGGVYNFGCEAIVRGAVSSIRKIYSNPKIIYFTYNYEFDIKVLKDLDIDIINIKKDVSIFKRIINKIISYTNIERHIMYVDYNNMMSMIDEIWSIGGDIYTIPEVKRKKKKYQYYNSLVDFCDRAINDGKKVVVYGASVGPFGNYKPATDYYVKNLSKYKRILCREYTSLNYLNSIGLTNCSFFPDPAFQIKDSNQHSYDPQYIGLNFSPLSLNEIYGNYNDDNIKKISGIVDEIIEKFNVRVLFIPHVISKYENDNDLSFQRKIIKFMRNKDKAIIANYQEGFLGLKEQIKKCRLIASARMHCAINAIDENIPAIFLSYSQKSIGICEYVYGNKKWLIPLNDVNNKLLQVISEMLNERDSISERLAVRNKEIQLEYDKLILELCDGD